MKEQILNVLNDRYEALDAIEINDLLELTTPEDLSRLNNALDALVKENLLYKTKKHNDGEKCFGGGWFLVSVHLPTGVVDNHYELKYWDLFHCPEVEKAPYPYDGHTPADALENGKRFLHIK